MRNAHAWLAFLIALTSPFVAAAQAVPEDGTVVVEARTAEAAEPAADAPGEATLTLTLTTAPAAYATPPASPVFVPETPPETVLVHHADRGLVAAGVGMLCAGWGVNTLGALAGEALVSFAEGNDWRVRYGVSFIPVVGPAIWGTWAMAINDSLWPLALFAYVDAAVQGVGLALLILGAIGVDEPMVAEGVRLTPFASGNNGGLLLDGTF